MQLDRGLFPTAGFQTAQASSPGCPPNPDHICNVVIRLFQGFGKYYLTVFSQTVDAGGPYLEIGADEIFAIGGALGSDGRVAWGGFGCAADAGAF
jgi:hypothetical protein